MSDQIKSVLFQDAVAEEYRRAVAQHCDPVLGINRQDAFAHAAEAIRRRHHAGEIEIPLEDAIHAQLVHADGREGAAADNILARIVAGDVGLDLWPDPMLEVVVTLGAGRRKPWRYVTAEDLTAMHDIRKRNTNAARRAERRFLKDVNAVYAEVVAAGTVGEMVARSRAARLAAS